MISLYLQMVRQNAWRESVNPMKHSRLEASPWTEELLSMPC